MQKSSEAQRRPDCAGKGGGVKSCFSKGKSFLGGKGKFKPRQRDLGPDIHSATKKGDLSEECGGLARAPDIYRGKKICLVLDLKGIFFFPF